MSQQMMKCATQRWPHQRTAAGLIIAALFMVQTMQAQTKEEQLIAASQAGASPLYFNVNAENIPLINKGDYNNPLECTVRNGLPNFFRKVRTGKPVTIGFIGGSITQGAVCYRPQAAKYIQSMFPTVPLKAINAGVSGTGTDLGACRLQEQLLQHHPDLVFVEFAVNGAYAPGMEGIIRQIRRFDANIDICLIYTINNGQSKIYAEGKIPDNIIGLEKVAAHYNIPSIHLGMEAAQLEKDNRLIWKSSSDVPGKIVFSNDGTHPVLAGGNLYAAAIARGMERMKSKAKAVRYSIPDALFTDNWEDAKMYAPLDIATFSKEWQQTPPRQQFAAWFPYVMQASQPGASFTFRFRGTTFGIFDIGGPEAGQLSITADGHPVRISDKATPGTRVYKANGENELLNRFNNYCSNRYRGQFDLVELGAGDHTVTITLSAQKADKVKILGPNQQEDIAQHPEKYDQTVINLGRVLIKGDKL